MASSLEFVEYICDQISGAGSITYKKMFGEYCVYCDRKVIGFICDDMFFVKKTDAGASVLTSLDEGFPYPKAKAHFLIESFDDSELISEFIRKTCDELPMPKPKKKKVDLVEDYSDGSKVKGIYLKEEKYY